MNTKKYVKDEKLRDLSIEQLRERADELRGEQMAKRFQRASGTLENYREIPANRRKLAAVLTVIHEKELAGGKS